MTNRAQRNALRVLFVDHSASQGGGQLSAERLIPRFTGISPVVVYMTDGPVAERLHRRGIETSVLLPASAFSHASAVRSLPALNRAIKTSGADLVVALSTAAAQYLSLVPKHGVPQLLRLSEDMERFENQGLKSTIYFRGVFPHFDGYIANSQWTRATVPDPLASRPVLVSYPLSGIAATPPARATPPLSSGTVRIACFSRPERWKGLDLAVEAVSTIIAGGGSGIELDLYGGGHNSDDAYIQELHQLAEPLGGSVRFKGHTDSVLGEMADVDIVIVPSRLPEPFGQVTVQAQNAGCLVIVSGHGGSLELVEDHTTGLTFEPGSAPSLAHQISFALANRALAQQIAARGHAASLNFSDEALAAQFESDLIELAALVRN